MWPRYRAAGRVEKGRILDEVCRVTGYHRKYAVRRLSGPPPESRPPRRRLRVPTYGKPVDHALRLVWEAANYPCRYGSRRCYGGCGWGPRISPRQIDRRLRPYKVKAKRRLYGRTKPGTLLKHHIPIRAERWEVDGPGWTEIDLVSHSGDRADGEFIHSLTLTDILTGWTGPAVLG
jgi:hypothetical protein